MRFAVYLFCLLLAGSPLTSATKLKLHKIRGIPGEYMVVLLRGQTQNDVPKIAKELGRKYGVEVGFTWDNALDGFTCRATEEGTQALAEDPLVAFVEQNFTMDSAHVSGTQWAYDLYNNYLWHLDRVDELSWSERDWKQNMCTEGRSIVAYVIDTGVRADHEQFEVPSRVVLSMNFSADRLDKVSTHEADATNACMNIVPNVNEIARSTRWHGTAVASVLGGTQVGVAKPRIVSLRVARCSDGLIEAQNLINALNWIGSTPPPRNRLGDPYGSQPGVINHSGYLPPWDGGFATYGVAVAGSVDRLGKPFLHQLTTTPLTRATSRPPTANSLEPICSLLDKRATRTERCSSWAGPW